MISRNKKKEFFASIANGNVLILKEEKLELAQVFFFNCIRIHE